MCSHVANLRGWPAVLAALLLSGLPALALDPDKTLTQYAHRIWGQEEGLVQPTIYSIRQTRDGFLWLGTQDSLIRFDGIHFRELDNAAEAGLQRSLIRALLEDRHGDLWAASLGSGVVQFSAGGRFKRFTTRNGLPSDDAFCLDSDAAGAVWVCTNKGLSEVQGEKIRVFTTRDGLPSEQIRDTCQAKDGTRWVAGFDFGLSRQMQSHFEPYSDSEIGPHENVTALACAADGSIWVGTTAGVVRVERHAATRFTTRQGLPDDEVSSLLQGPDGSVWIGTNDGISRYRNGEIDVYRTRDGLSHSLVLSMLVDREGSLWAGTKDGLDQFTDGKVTPYTTNEGMSSNDAGPVLEDNAGRLWVGTLGHGLNVFDGHRFQAVTRKNGLLDDTIFSLQVDSYGDLWAGSARGLNRLREGKVVATYTAKNGLTAGAVRALAIDAQGTLWAGTGNGLQRFDGRRFLKTDLPIPGGVIAISRGRTVRLFISTDSPGFSYLENNRISTYSLDVTHPVDCYYLDPDRHEAWLGTSGSGLLYWRNGNVTHIRVKDGLFDNRIYNILRDDSGNFWMASSKGIFRVSENDLRAFADGQSRYVTSIPFSTGQLRFECRSGVQPAACRTRDGRLWFSTTNGLVVLDPNHLASNSVAPPARITSVVINGQRVESYQALRLQPFRERNIEVRYAGLSFVAPEKVSFRYLLEGYDKRWTEAGNRREAFFTNLPPGDFRFRVKARNADGIWSKEDATLSFTVEPRLYQHWWFYPLLAALAAALAIFWYRLRIRRLKQRFDLVLAERSRIARELHDTLLQGLAGITMQLQALWTKLPASKEKVFLGEIIQDAAKCSTEARQTLWGLRHVGSGPVEFPEKLGSLIKQAVEQSEIQLVLNLSPVSLSPWPEVEYQLLRIAQEAVSNALRHSQAKKLEVSLHATVGAVELTVADNGTGFDSDHPQFGHFGLVGMRERAAEIGAHLSLTSAPGRGTTVTVSLPRSREIGENYTEPTLITSR